MYSKESQVLSMISMIEPCTLEILLNHFGAAEHRRLQLYLDDLARSGLITCKPGNIPTLNKYSVTVDGLALLESMEKEYQRQKQLTALQTQQAEEKRLQRLSNDKSKRQEHISGIIGTILGAVIGALASHFLG